MNDICKEESAGVRVVKRVRPFFPNHSLAVICKSLVQTQFDYCFPLCDICGKALKDKLQHIQSRQARAITGAKYDIRSTDIFPNLGWKTLENN